MHSNRPTRLHTTLLTGATGFIGHNVLADLLLRGERCLVLLRQPFARSVQRLSGLLKPLGIDVEREVSGGRLSFIEGQLGDGRPLNLSGRGVHRILHCAGLTRLDESSPEQTRRVNINGAMELLGVAEHHGVRDLHLVSTAYTCGRTQAVVDEDHAAPTSFHNTYEASKWEAECAWRTWAKLNDARVTIYRPSIVVGDRTAGRVTRLAGVYLVARTIKMLADAAERDTYGRQRHASINLACLGESIQNLVPVDYVAQMIGHAVTHPQWHGRNYHLTHPSPPTNYQVKAAIEEAFSLFAGSWSRGNRVRSTFQDAFEQVAGSLRPYLDHQPRFLRHHSDQLEHSAGLACPRYCDDELVTMFTSADRDGWGRHANVTQPSREPMEAYDQYFFRFLPDRLKVSRVAHATAVSCTMRFVLTDLLGGDWLCHFVRGQLSQSTRTASCRDNSSDFTYLTTSKVFWTALCGQADPQAVFLDGSAVVQGNLEQAMKMAVILREFSREFPCTREEMMAEVGTTKEAVAC